MNNSFPEVGHQSNQSRIPLIGYLRERRRAAGHQDLPDPVLEALDAVLIDSDECLRCDFLRVLVLQLPDAIFLREFLHSCSDLREDPHFEARHVEQ